MKEQIDLLRNSPSLKKLMIASTICLMLTACDSSSFDQLKNDIPIKGHTSDKDITKNIRELLENDDMLSDNAKEIEIETINGNVTLSGTVKSEKERSEIIKHVEKVHGVKNIEDELEVNDSEISYLYDY